MAEKNLIAWSVDAADYPASGELDEKLKFLLNYAVLAPSGPNNQPWKLAVDGSEATVKADFGRTLPDVEPTNRTMYMSLGCALTNLLIAAEHFGLGYRVERFPDGIDAETIATVKFEEEAAQAPQFPPYLFDEITERHTNRGAYDDRPIEADKIEAMKEAVGDGGFRLDVLTDPDGRAAMAEVLGESHKIQLGIRPSERTWPGGSGRTTRTPGTAFQATPSATRTSSPTSASSSSGPSTPLPPGRRRRWG